MLLHESNGLDLCKDSPKTVLQMDELLAVVAEDVIETQGKTKPRAIHTKTALRIRRNRQSQKAWLPAIKVHTGERTMHEFDLFSGFVRYPERSGRIIYVGSAMISV